MLDEVLISINSDTDIVAARDAGRRIAAAIGFRRTDLTLIATTISELARHLLRQALTGTITISATEETSSGRRGILILACDGGTASAKPGQSGFDEVLLGLPRLVDDVELVTAAGQSTVAATKWLPSRPLPPGA